MIYIYNLYCDNKNQNNTNSNLSLKINSGASIEKTESNSINTNNDLVKTATDKNAQQIQRDVKNSSRKELTNEQKKQDVQKFLLILQQTFPGENQILNFIIIIGIYLLNFSSFPLFFNNLTIKKNKQELNEARVVLSNVFKIIFVFVFIFCIGDYIVNFNNNVLFNLFSYMSGFISLILFILSSWIIQQDIVNKKKLYLINFLIVINLFSWYISIYLISSFIILSFFLIYLITLGVTFFLMFSPFVQSVVKI